MNKNIDPESRGETIHRWRTMLGWSAAETAERLSVTSRTLSTDENGGTVPDARWRLFVHEVSKELREGRRSGGLLIINAEDGITLLDVVSFNNFAGYALSDDGRVGLIASYAIDPRTGQHRIHKQQFSVAANPGIFPIVSKWERQRMVDAGNNQELHMRQWVTRMALKGALNNPTMESFKQKQRETQERLEASEFGTKEYDKRFAENEAAVAAIFQEMCKTPKR